MTKFTPQLKEAVKKAILAKKKPATVIRMMTDKGMAKTHASTSYYNMKAKLIKEHAFLQQTNRPSTPIPSADNIGDTPDVVSSTHATPSIERVDTTHSTDTIPVTGDGVESSVEVGEGAELDDASSVQSGFKEMLDDIGTPNIDEPGVKDRVEESGITVDHSKDGQSEDKPEENAVHVSPYEAIYNLVKGFDNWVLRERPLNDEQIEDIRRTAERVQNVTLPMLDEEKDKNAVYYNMILAGVTPILAAPDLLAKRLVELLNWWGEFARGNYSFSVKTGGPQTPPPPTVVNPTVDSNASQQSQQVKLTEASAQKDWLDNGKVDTTQPIDMDYYKKTGKVRNIKWQDPNYRPFGK